MIGHYEETSRPAWRLFFFLFIMSRMRLLVLTIGALLALPVCGYSAKVKLRTLRTKDLRLVYYTTDHEYITPHLAACFENSMAFHRLLFDYTPSEEVTVLLQDFDDIGYAGATGVPYNWMSLGIAPYEYVYEVSPTNERLNWVMSHELVHVLASDQAAPSDRFFRKLFGGKVSVDDEDPVSLLYGYLTSPRNFAPRWYHEGMAVFMETWMAGGYGRVLGGYDEMVWRAMVHDDARFYQLVGLESEGTTTDFQVGQNAYLYGTRFISYCAYEYGPAKVVDWVRRTKGTKSSYSGQFKQVFGKPLSRAWREWIEWEHVWQQANIDSVRQYPLTEYRTLSKEPLGSVSRGYYDPDSRKLYTAVLYPGEFSHIAEIDIDTWDIDKIAEIKTPALYYVTSLAYDETGDRVFFTTDNSSGWRDVNRVDVKSRAGKMTCANCRTGDLVFNPTDNSLWGIEHHNGLSSLVRIPEPYDHTQVVLTLPYGRDMFDIDLSPEGKHLTASTLEVSGRRQLIRMHVASLVFGDTKREVLFEFPKNSPANFVHSRDGKYLFGTSYYSGVSNVYRYDLNKRRMEIITNTDTGFFRPVPVSQDSLIVFRYTSKGFVPCMIGIEPIDVLAQSSPQAVDTTTAADATVDVSGGGEDQVGKSEVTIRPIRFAGQAIVDEHPVVAGWMLGSPREVNLDSLTIEAGDYSGFRNIRLNSVYPVVQSYKNRVAFGLRFNIMERNGLHFFDVATLYSPSESLSDDEKGHAQATYIWGPWKFEGAYNRSDFYDFFGPTKTSRKGYSLAVEYDDFIIYEKPTTMTYSIRLAAYAGLDRLPDYQNVRVIFEEYLSASANVHYEMLEKTIGGAEKERGIEWQLNALDNWVNPKNVDSPVASDRHNYPRLWFNLNYGFLLPWNHSSVWLRPSLGSSLVRRTDPPEPLNNFYFGGFGNNWVDHGSVKRYREHHTFPGVGLNQVSGANYGKLMIEWVLPPVRFRNVGAPWLYANWVHLSLFGSGIITNFDNRSSRQALVNVGAQLDFKIVSFFSLPYTLSVGYARAFEDDRRYTDEYILSLAIF
ncbi:MAG: hypothetical protein OEN01_06290 [Candidatus Krumholzibacteria bacterium]|nr:hypothetical protein [Candidatus Krumholzibacteria bacterium]